MRLYFDIGNTNIKLNFNLNNQEYYFNFDTKSQKSVDVFYTSLPKELKQQKISQVFICSVVPSVEDIVVGSIKKYMQIKPIFLKHPIKTGIRIKTNSPQNVGADLIALAAFVNKNSKKGIIVNIGTATTIVVVANRSLEGVIIAPGLMTSYNSLVKNASKISEVELIRNTELNLGKTTSEAISVGLFKGHSHMILGLVNSFSGDYDLFISGGHASKIRNFLNNFKYVKEATIAGMKVIEEYNEK